MASFLYRVADSFYRHYYAEISRFTFVFPNRRAGLFFQRYLSEVAQKPLFSPEVITINECFSSASEWESADRLANLFKLYRIFVKHSGSDETFDSFVFWGEMLLSDFEEVDKYLVDASQLFTNVTELKDIDRLYNYFTEKQIEAIRQFWTNFVPVNESSTHDEFMATWKVLYPVYREFRDELIAEEIATEGMICRHVVERLIKGEDMEALNGKQFVFVGFNALNPCERALMHELKKRQQADFYWDYEAAELRDPENPASMFYAENIHVFPSSIPIAPQCESLQDKTFNLIAVPSSTGQAKQVYSALNTLYPVNENRQDWIKTAVVLPDENLLVPLLHSLPSQVGKINITMGFPVSATPVSGLIEHIFELWRRVRTSGQKTSFYHQNVTDILNHQYISSVCKDEIMLITTEMTRLNKIYIDAAELQSHPLLSAIFDRNTTDANFIAYLLKVLKNLQYFQSAIGEKSESSRLENDFLYQYYISINRLHDIINDAWNDEPLALDTQIRLIRQLTAGVSIPFIGEPLDGLQIMGVLETRGLDFENLIITSFNEGVYPGKGATNSFIPYNLRRGFGLPTYEYQDAITSYNFYRLIQRAKNITFIYDSRTEGMQTGEVSRFIHQLYYHYGIRFNRKTVTYDIGFGSAEPISIEKTPAVVEKISCFLSDDDNAAALSASSIKDYIECPLRFYLTRVEDMEQPDEITETIEDNMFGNLFHATMEYIYQPFKGKIITTEDFEQIISNPLLIDKQINKAFAVKYFKLRNTDTVELEGNNLLIAHVIRKYIVQVLRTDKLYAPFKYVDSEYKCRIRIPISVGHVNIKGFIDRIDEKEGRIRILDYKTGSGKLEFKSVEEVFEHNNDKRPKYVLQTFLYGILYKSQAQGKTIVPGIYYMRDVFKDGFITELQYKQDSKTRVAVEDFTDFEQEFMQHLTACLEELFDPSTPFVQSVSSEPCKYCPFTGVCKR